MLVLLVLISYLSPLRSSFNRNFDVEGGEKLKSIEDGWYILDFQSIPSNEVLNTLNIHYNTSSIISNRLYKIYLKAEQLDILISKYNVSYIHINKKAKYVKSGSEDGEIKMFMVESNEQITSNDLYNATHMYCNVYLVETSNTIESIRYLMEKNYISTIDEVSRPKINNRFGIARILGSNVPTLHDGIFETQRIVDLNGSGEIILITDSGIDMKSTFFYDPQNPNFQYNTVNKNNRKVIYYDDQLGDNTDDTKTGHGTHVSGIAAGYPVCGENCTMYLYRGIAHQAKIAFIDLGMPSNPESLRFLPSWTIDVTLALTNARTISSSWGQNGESLSMKRMYDEAGYNFEDVLFVFSAGNEGNKNGNVSYYTIGSPSTSKNVLSIGNLGSPFTASLEEGSNLQTDFGMDTNFLLTADKDYLVHAALWAKSPIHCTFDGSISGDITKNPSDSKDKILWIKDLDSCNAILNLNNETVAVIITESRNGILKCEGEVKFPVLYTHEKIKSVKNVKISPVVLPGYENILNGIHPTSSRGPTDYGCIKPDISAVGAFVMSARSMPKTAPINHDELHALMGTSMAAPMVSGASLLIRQYFVQGYYPGGKVDPGAALLRALLAASADPLGAKTVNVDSGHGVANLENILIMDKQNMTRGIRIANKINISKNDHMTATINIPHNQGDLRIAIAYQDFPLSSDSMHVLSADLAFFVVSPSGKIFYGNHHENDQEEHFACVKRVLIHKNEVEIGEYTIHVIAEGEMSEPIKFSCAVSGPFPNNQNPLLINFADANTCGTTCSGHGTCGKICKCDSGYTGSNCQTQVINLSPENRIIEEIPSLNSIFLNISVPHNYSSIVVGYERKGSINKAITLIYQSIDHFSPIPILSDEMYSSTNKIEKLAFNSSSVSGGSNLYLNIYNNSPYRIELHVSLQIVMNTGSIIGNDIEDDTNNGGHKLKAGGIVGIAIGSVAFVAIVVLTITLIILFKKKKNEEEIRPPAQTTQIN